MTVDDVKRCPLRFRVAHGLRLGSMFKPFKKAKPYMEIEAVYVLGQSDKPNRLRVMPTSWIGDLVVRKALERGREQSILVEPSELFETRALAHASINR